MPIVHKLHVVHDGLNERFSGQQIPLITLQDLYETHTAVDTGDSKHACLAPHRENTSLLQLLLGIC